MNAIRSETIWASIWDTVNVGLILLDSDGKIVLWNNWLANRSAISAEHAIGNSLDALFPDSLTVPFKTAIQNALLHKLPIVLSNALHRSPLPLYPMPSSEALQARIEQSITITPIINHDKSHRCLVQITDASVSIKRERLLKSHSDQLSIEATTDSLTGAFNRRFFDNRYSAEFSRAQRQELPLALLMLDVDYFKDYNDHYGHPAGDRALIAVVKSIQLQLNRASDVLTRYGGEEFAVILPDCGTEGSMAVAKKLLDAINKLDIPHSKSKISDHLTISIGISIKLPNTNCNQPHMLEAVDIALYRAKHNGRNCVSQLFAHDFEKTT